MDGGFYDLKNGCFEYQVFLEKHYSIQLKNLDRTKIYTYFEKQDAPLGITHNISAYVFSFFAKRLIFNKNKTLPICDTGIMYYEYDKWKILSNTGKYRSLEEVISRKTQFDCFLEKEKKSINFLKTATLSELKKNKLYVVMYQNHGAADRYSNIIRGSDTWNFCPAKFTGNHVGLLFFHKRTNKWYILEQYVRMYLTACEDVIKWYFGQLYAIEINGITLTNKQQEWLYDKLRDARDIHLLATDKKTDKYHIKHFAATRAAASYQLHFGRNDRFFTIRCKKIFNSTLQAISRHFRRTNLESPMKSFCSEKIIPIIRQLDKNNLYFPDKIGHPYNYTVKDVINRILYVDNKNLEENALAISSSQSSE
jgi:hypothetical protein